MSLGDAGGLHPAADASDARDTSPAITSTASGSTSAIDFAPLRR